MNRALQTLICFLSLSTAYSTISCPAVSPTGQKLPKALQGLWSGPFSFASYVGTTTSDNNDYSFVQRASGTTPGGSKLEGIVIWNCLVNVTIMLRMV